MREQHRPLVIAHRGASGEAPENTMAAFRLALEQGADGIECDVHMTADGVPVLLHDEHVDRTTSGQGRLRDLAWSDLQALDAGSWFGAAFRDERVPSLPQALEELGPRCAWFLEVKELAATAHTLAVVSEVSVEKQVTLLSFLPQVLADARRLAPALPRVLNSSLASARSLDEALSLGCAGLDVAYEKLSPELADAAKAAGLRLYAWGVNDARVARRAQRLGLAGIITDRPGKASESLTPASRPVPAAKAARYGRAARGRLS
jgi:glycerophosphoryl diester phosphodiesterase